MSIADEEVIVYNNIPYIVYESIGNIIRRHKIYVDRKFIFVAKNYYGIYVRYYGST